MAADAGKSTGCQIRMKRRALVITTSAFIALLCVTQLRGVIGDLALNMAERYHVQSLLQADIPLNLGMVVQSGTFSAQTDAAKRALLWSKVAVNLKDDWRSEITQARILIESGIDDDLMADNELSDNQFMNRPFDVAVVLRSLINKKRFQSVIDSMASVPEAQISDEERSLVELALMNIARDSLSGDSKNAEMLESSLQQVLAYNPYNLWANIRLLETLPPASSEREYILQNLHEFPASSLTPIQPEAVSFIAEAVRDLLYSGIWTEAEAYQALTTLVWRFPMDNSLEQVLNQLRQNYPNDPTYDFLLGELLFRSSTPNHAFPHYTTAALQGNLPSIQRIAEICHFHQIDCTAVNVDIAGELDKALKSRWESVEKFCNWQFDTAMLCLPASAPDNTVMDTIAQRSISDGLILPGIMSLPGKVDENGGLGENLLPNSNFETWSKSGYPDQWWLQEMSYADGKGAFIGGRDMHPLGTMSENAVKITGFWMDENYASYGIMLGDNGAEVPVTLQPNKTYLLTAIYSTDQTSDQAVRLWTSSYFPLCDQPTINPLPSEIALPSTEQLRIRVDLLLCPPDVEQDVKQDFELPIALRLWSPGSLVIDNLMIREVASLPQ